MEAAMGKTKEQGDLRYQERAKKERQNLYVLRRNERKTNSWSYSYKKTRNLDLFVN